MKNILMKVKRWLQGWFVESIKESAETERHLAQRNLLRKVESRRMHVRMVHADEQENFRFKEDGISSTKSLLMVRMAEFVRTYYEVRFNKLSQQYELSRKGEGRWDKFDDELCCRMLMEMNSVGIAVAKPYLVRTVVHGGDLARMYHPVCAYLEGLPAWDGVGHIEALFRRVTDDEQLLVWLRKWFLAMVAQIRGCMGTYGNSVCPILISSKQGWGKSQFAKMMVPPQLRVFYTDTFNLAQEDACLRRMTAYMLINVDEVDRFKDTRMATFKNLIQLSAVSMKRAYRSQMEERERMASFIATSNRRYLLHDESGSRRFICVELTHPIDVDTPVDYWQLYAEAMVALDRGERYWFNDKETRVLEAHNADYAAYKGAWDLLNRHFCVCEVPECAEERNDTLWPATEVFDYLHELSPTSMSGVERSGFALYLKRMGAKQVRVKNRRLYGVRCRGDFRTVM